MVKALNECSEPSNGTRIFSNNGTNILYDFISDFRYNFLSLLEKELEEKRI